MSSALSLISSCSSPRSAARGGFATVSTAIDQTEALRELRSDHEILRREVLATRRRAEDLDRQLADAANTASPFVLFCHHKYELIHHQLESTRTEIAECLNALQERLDNSRELEACRLRNHDLQLRYNEAVSEFQDRISTLEAQLAAASSFGVIVPPDTARRLADLESQLARSHSDLQVARDRRSSLASELRESAASQQAAQAEVDRLEATIERETRRFRTLRESYERRLKVADNTITARSVELVRLRDRVLTLSQDLQQGSQRIRTATSQRDQARIERNATPWRFTEVTDLRAERDQAQERLSNFASLLPSTLGHKRTRSEPDSPAPPARVSKAARSTPGPFSTSALSEGPASRSSIEVLSAVAADQKAEEPVSPPLFAGLPDPPPRSTRSTTQD
ncbi:hypothetical protein F444_14527, partial [Phytophthora nicotianae P1976]